MVLRSGRGQMNPDNNSLERTYFIGGPPRVGKSILAYRFATKINGHVVSTDAIRNAAKKSCKDKNSDLFILNKEESLPTQDWLRVHIDSPKRVVEQQNRESIALWPSLVSFANSFVEDDVKHVIEGVAILPSLVAEMKNRPQNVIFVGNTSKNHADSLLLHSKENPEKDWMASMNYSKEKIIAMNSFINEMSDYFQREANKFGFSYFEMSDTDFDSYIDEIIKNIQ